MKKILIFITLMISISCSSVNQKPISKEVIYENSINSVYKKYGVIVLEEDVQIYRDSRNWFAILYTPFVDYKVVLDFNGNVIKVTEK